MVYVIVVSWIAIPILQSQPFGHEQESHICVNKMNAFITSIVFVMFIQYLYWRSRRENQKDTGGQILGIVASRAAFCAKNHK